MDTIKYYTCVNKYNYQVKQLYINFKERIYCVGSFKQNVNIITHKALNEKIEELKLLNFKEVKERY